MRPLSKQFVISIAIIFTLQFSCNDNITGSRDYDQWYGQVVSEFVKLLVRPDGTVWAWGVNFNGTLGDGTTESRDIPGKVLNLTDVISIDQSNGAAVAVDKSGNIWFWGNSMLYHGPPDVDTNATVPLKIARLKGIKSIALTAVHIFLLKNDGTVWYIRLDWYSPKIVDGPRKIEGITGVISVHKSLALTLSGKIYDLFSKEILQDNLKDITAISGSRNRHILVLKRDGTIWAWGRNDLGQLGNGTFEDSEEPTKVKNLNDVVAISANYSFNSALKKDGTVWFWGFAGREGDTLIGVNIPVKIEGLTGIVLISAGYESLVMKNDGTYWDFNVKDRIPKQVQFD